MPASCDRLRLHRVADCVAGRVRLALPQPTERQRIGDQIDTAFIFRRANFVNAVQRKANAGIVSVVHVIPAVLYHFAIAVRRAEDNRG